MYVCGAFTEGYVVGARLKLSGLFQQQANGEFEHLGPSHPMIRAVAVSGERIYLAAGNGCIRALNGGRDWRQTTGWEVTEPLDVEVDPFTPQRIYLALPDGIYISSDSGEKWAYSNRGLDRLYIQALVTDRHQRGVVLAGGESGIYRSKDAGASWTRVVAGMFTKLVQVDAKRWWAGTQSGGLWRSLDGGLTFRRVENVSSKATIYSITTDGKKRVAITSWDFGLLESEDDGAAWHDASPGAKRLWTAAYDPRTVGGLWVSVHEKGLFRRDSSASDWKLAGLEGTVIEDIAFIPGVKA